MLKDNFKSDETFYYYCKYNYDDIIELLGKRYIGITQVHKVNSYCKFHNLQYTPATFTTASKPVVSRMTLEEAKSVIEKVVDKKHKAFLMLLVNKTGSVRNDYANVKIFERTTSKTANGYYHKDTGVVDIKKLNKTGRVLKFTLEPDVKKAVDEYLEEYGGEYLYDCKHEDEIKRGVFYCRYIKYLSKEYFGYEFTSNSFRRMVAQDRYDNSESIEEYVNNSKLSDHTALTEVNSYIDKNKPKALSEGDMLVSLLKLGYTIKK